MQSANFDLLKEISCYYADKLAQHGATPRGVDWNSEESQIVRFEQLCKIMHDTQVFSLTDIGCGYGALFDFLVAKRSLSSYLGVDISEDMIHAARQHHSGHSQAQFIVAADPTTISDYAVASGIFNVRLNRNDVEWLDYIQSTLDVLHRTSRYGFAFNCLTSYSDEDKKRAYL